MSNKGESSMLRGARNARWGCCCVVARARLAGIKKCRVVPQDGLGDS